MIETNAIVHSVKLGGMTIDVVLASDYGELKARADLLEKTLHKLVDDEDYHSTFCDGGCMCAERIAYEVLPAPTVCEDCKRPYDFSHGRKRCSFCHKHYHWAALEARNKP